MAKAALWCGIFAALFGLSPFLSGWFLILTFVVWILAILAIIFGIIALVKKQPVATAVIGLVLAIFGILCPYIFTETFAENAVESTSNALEKVSDMTDMAGSFSSEE